MKPEKRTMSIEISDKLKSPENRVEMPMEHFCTFYFLLEDFVQLVAGEKRLSDVDVIACVNLLSLYEIPLESACSIIQEDIKK